MKHDEEKRRPAIEKTRTIFANDFFEILEENAVRFGAINAKKLIAERIEKFRTKK